MCISAFASGNLWQFKIPSGNQTWLAGHALQMEVFMGKSSINEGLFIAVADYQRVAKWN